MYYNYFYYYYVHLTCLTMTIPKAKNPIVWIVKVAI